jgi:uncharacterized membrane protein YoaK (UPF0700 family)
MGCEQRARSIMAVLLAGVAGFIDAVGYLTLDLFTAHMSGNSARLGVYLGQGAYLRAAPAGYAIGVFVISISLGVVAMELGTRTRLRSPTALVVGSEAALLLVLALYGTTVTVNGRIAASSTGAYYGLAALAVGAIGLQTSALQRISGHTVRTTYVSGMLTVLASELVSYLLDRRGMPVGQRPRYLRDELGLAPGPRSRWRITLSAAIWAMYALGAIGGSYLQHRWQLHCLAVPVAVLGIVLAIELCWPRR